MSMTLMGADSVTPKQNSSEDFYQDPLIREAVRRFEQKLRSSDELLYQQNGDKFICVTDINEEVKRYFARHPERLHDLEPRKFEILIADILKDLGFETELT